VKTLNMALKVIDYLIENSVEMLEEDERNQIDIVHDITFNDRKQMTRRLIDSVIVTGREMVQNILETGIDLSHSDTYSFQTAIYKQNSLMAKKVDKSNKKLKVQNPYMDNTSLRKGSYFDVTMPNSLTENNTIVLWSYAHESFRRPSEVHWVSNMIWLGAYDNKGKYSEINSNLTVRFPLRVLLPDLDLKEHFKCAKMSIDKNGRETVKLFRIKSLNEDEGDVECVFKTVKIDEFMTVVYTNGMTEFLKKNKWEMLDKGDDDVQMVEEGSSLLKVVAGLCIVLNAFIMF
jgi:hypothetical protein